MNSIIKNIIILPLIFLVVSVIAKENVFNPAVSVVNTKVASGCAPSSSKTDLDVNNVRATIMGGGDMWWDLSDAQYEIPKGGNRNSLFAGALWIGGVDDGGNLKVAAMTYRQSGNDFWTGPLDANATISPEECEEWDTHFKITRAEVEDHVARQGIDPTYTMPESIEFWPAYGNTENAGFRELAPYKDVNNNGIYDPLNGDYPDYNVSGEDSLARLYGDETLWWVFNDKGNIHTESEADPLGLEIHAQAFGFTADNELNDMTFYNYTIINRSTLPLNDTYFGQWVDPDLGYYLDDYVGCDVSKGLGFCYNGDAEDEGGSGYGFNPPAIGVDFFQGPLADPGDGIDNNRNGIVDEEGEDIIMSKFVYYNNDNTVIGNPSEGIHFYNYLRGIWKDNVPMTYGGDGHGSGSGSTSTLCDFMFPGSTDSLMNSMHGEWTEVTAGNIPADRRFLQSAGPFTLQPGAVNEITTGVIWARAKSGGQTASINLVKVYDIEAQALFKSNFNILNGPDAPDLEIRELDKELIITLSNGPTSNNVNESYSEEDPYIFTPYNLINNPNYEFQGYLVYQLKDGTVSQTDLSDPDLARLIFRCDVKDSVMEIVNHYKDEELKVWTPVLEVSGVISEGVQGAVDEGTQYSFQVTDDKFALGNTKLVNHKTYYFMAIAYGFNAGQINSNPYDPDSPGYDGKNQPFIRGRRNIKVKSGIPRLSAPSGTVLNASYGDGVEVTRIEGKGNGSQNLDLISNMLDDLFDVNSEYKIKYPTYQAGKGPVDIKVVDPAAIPKGSYVLKLNNPTTQPSIGVTGYGGWTLEDSISGDIIALSNQNIEAGKETYIPELGMSVGVKQALQPAADYENNPENGFISGTIEFEKPSDRWLTGVPDRDDENNFSLWGWGLNWIRAGEYDASDPADLGTPLLNDYGIDEQGEYDKNGVFESAVQQTITVPYTNVPFGSGSFSIEITGGTWSPYRYASYFHDGPGYKKVHDANSVNMRDLNSVDIVFTSDKDKWSRVCIVEAQDDQNLSIGGQTKMGLRQSASVDKEGNPDQSGTIGMGWFPGYAVDLETGERLNIIFAEDSWQTSENGNDMKWNPTSNVVSDGFPQWDPPSLGSAIGSPSEFTGASYLLGGKHFVYVMGGSSWVKSTADYLNNETALSKNDDSPNYDEGAWIYNRLSNDDANGTARWQVFRNCTWVGIPLLAQGSTIPTSTNSNDATVKLRVTKPYKQYETVSSNKFLSTSMNLTIGSTYVVAYRNVPSGTSGTQWGGKEITHDGNTYQPGEIFLATSSNFSGSSEARVVEHNSINSFNPTYSFNTSKVYTSNKNTDLALDAIEEINVVPNPYYGYSEYETTQLDNRIKITNLPNRATISIFTVSGTLVKKIEKDDNMSTVDWDLKNDFGIPIASGLYIIHVRVKHWDDKKREFVEKDKIIKWFGALRPIDLDTF